MVPMPLPSRGQRHLIAVTLIAICTFYWINTVIPIIPTGNRRPDQWSWNRLQSTSRTIQSTLLSSILNTTAPTVLQTPEEPTRKTAKGFPKLIWQTSSPSSRVKWASEIRSWTNRNPTHKYMYLNDDDLTTAVHTLFADRQSIVYLWDSVTDPILRADLFRYLILLSQGGVYSDIDTTCLVPIDQWIPPSLQERAHAVVGIEYNGEPTGWSIRPISFSQWTLMAKPNHALFATLVNRVTANLELLSRTHQTNLSSLHLSFNEVLAATGPGLITDCIMQTIRDQTGKSTFDFDELKNIRGPKLYGDLLVLPINAFAGAQEHSHSGELAWGRKLVKHHFGRSWYAKTKQGPTRHWG